MTEYIEREEIRGAYEKLTRSYVNDDPYIADWRFDEMIENLPASDVAPVRHGRWGSNGIPDSVLSACSVCGFGCGAYSFQYCPNCGARMDGYITMPDCENCNERCPKAEMAHEIALGRMYTTNELLKLVKKIEIGQMVEVVRCRDCNHCDQENYHCDHYMGSVAPLRRKPDDFCSYGERKEVLTNGC